MNIQVNGRRLEVTGPIREYVEDRGSRLFRFFDRIQKVQFVLSTQGVRFTAEVVVSAPKGGRLVAEATEDRAYDCAVRAGALSPNRGHISSQCGRLLSRRFY